MAQPKPPVIETAAAAWRDAFRAIGAMPEVTGIALVFVLATSLAGFAIFPNPYALVGSPWLPVISIVSGVVQAILLAPLAIAVHRFVILGETANRYPLRASEQPLPALRRLRDPCQNSLADPEHDPGLH